MLDADECVVVDQAAADGVTSAFTFTLSQSDILAPLTRIAVSTALTASATSAASSVRVVSGIGGLACSLLLAYVCSML